MFFGVNSALALQPPESAAALSAKGPSLNKPRPKGRKWHFSYESERPFWCPQRHHRGIPRVARTTQHNTTLVRQKSPMKAQDDMQATSHVCELHIDEPGAATSVDSHDGKTNLVGCLASSFEKLDPSGGPSESVVSCAAEFATLAATPAEPHRSPLIGAREPTICIRPATRTKQQPQCPVCICMQGSLQTQICTK